MHCSARWPCRFLRLTSDAATDRGIDGSDATTPFDVDGIGGDTISACHLHPDAIGDLDYAP